MSDLTIEPLVEISLDDAFKESIVSEAMPMVHPSVMNDHRMSLPAALVDDELLSEISNIPDKMGFKIGEVAEILGVAPYVLRYWESEFEVLKPKKAANKQRYYTRKEVENALMIRKLLYRDRFSIEGARSALKEIKNVVKKEKEWTHLNHRVESLQERVDGLIVDLKRLSLLFS